MTFNRKESVNRNIMNMFTSIIQTLTDQQKVLEEQDQKIQKLTNKIRVMAEEGCAAAPSIEKKD